MARKHSPSPMSLREYLKNRDTFILTKVYAEFIDIISGSGISEKEFASRLRNAFTQGASEWQQAEPEPLARRIDRTKV